MECRKKHRGWSAWASLAVSCAVLLTILPVSCAVILVEGDRQTTNVKVRVYVHEPGEKGVPIPAAQVIENTTGELLGLTSHDGLMDFMAPPSARNVTVHVQADNYLPRDYVIKLLPANQATDVKIALFPRRIITAPPGDSGYTFRFGNSAYITVPPRGFKKNGTVHNDLVMFDGMYMDSSEEGFLDMVDGDQFVVGGMPFALSHIWYLHFTDSQGNRLDVDSYHYSNEVQDRELSEQAPFLVTFDHSAQQWNHHGELTHSTSLQTRQASITRVLENSNVPFALFLGQAMALNASCWLQARTFDTNLNPLIGLIVTVIQEGNIGGIPFMYRFGSSTGSAGGDLDLVSNTICLPLECESFTIGTVEGNQAVREPRNPITPVDFPPGTFNASEIRTPTIVGGVFAFQKIITASPDNPKPFYSSPDDCLANGREDPLSADPADYFSFIDMQLSAPPPTENCYIKVLIHECLNTTSNFVTVTSGQLQRIEDVNFADVEDPPTPSGADNASEACIESSKVACISYTCSEVVSIAVKDGDGTSSCNISSLAPTLQVPLLTEDSSPDMLTIHTEVLATHNYNNVNLGLYYDSDPMIAEDLCLMTNSNADDSLSSGYAATFNCISNIIRDSAFVLENDTVTLSCSSLSTGIVPLQQEVQVTWTLTDLDGILQPIYPLSTDVGSDRYSLNTDRWDPLFGQLTIERVVYEDTGSYRCSADGTNIVTEIVLQVHVPPKVLSVSNESRVELGNQVNLTCLVSGYPQPTITWQKESEEIIDQNNRTQVFTTIKDNLETLSTLQILNTQGTDSAHYTCRATNSLPGQQTGVQSVTSPQVVLRILSIPDPPVTVIVADVGPTWVFLQWRPGFDGNSPFDAFIITASPGIQVRVTVSTTEQNGRFIVNITEDILPSTTYQFGVQACNMLGCSDASYSDTVQTEQNRSTGSETVHTTLIIGVTVGAIVLVLILFSIIGVVLCRVKHRSNRSGDGTISVSSTLQKNDVYLETNPATSPSYATSDMEPNNDTDYYAYATAGSRVRYAEIGTAGNPLYQSVSSPEKSEEPTYDRIREKTPDSPKYASIPMDSNPSYIFTPEGDEHQTQLTTEV